MTTSRMLLSAVIALTLPPSAALAAVKSTPRVSPAAQSLSLSAPVRAGAATGKRSHILGLGLLGTLLIAAGAVAAAVVVADTVDNGSSG
jgi:hypothetical protein